jgi:metal-responsive CopG/Arc/MetJ family transcriptional regulator
VIGRTRSARRYTGLYSSMKTAISIQDDTFERVSKRAAALGLSRSEFFSTAARRYLDELDAQSLCREIDEVLDLVSDDDSNDAAIAAGRNRLARDAGAW